MLLAVCVVVSFSIGAFVGIKGVQIGLRFKLQIEDNKEPVISNPLVDNVKEFFEKKEVKKFENAQNEMVTDILGGMDDE